MNVNEFKESLSRNAPPDGIGVLLTALWFDGKNDWAAAHNIAQEVETPDGSWVHAYLHRKEGDDWNAGYWYRRAQQPVCNKTLDEEWDDLVTVMLKKHKT